MNRRITALASVLGAFITCLAVSHSCANTTTPPSGGPKDTIPPVLLQIVPEQNKTGFPLTKGNLTLTFNEYTIVKTPTDILLSPTVKKKPKTKIKGKSIVVMFQDTLKENTTYTLDFGQALADNNEGNPAPRLVYTFSTGTEIDSMYITGSVIDCQTLQPQKKIFVGLYSDLSDSACFKAPPDAVGFTDDWGFFSIRNIKPIEYRMYAFTDADGDYIYNPDGDKVAFLDSVIVPSGVVRDSIFELMPFDMKDTLRCRARIPMYTMSLFEGLQSIQYLQNSGRMSDRMGFLKFSAENVKINSLQFYSVDSSDILLQYNPLRDSLNFWIKSKYAPGDSLLMKLNYMMTDSTGTLAATDTMIAMGMPRDSVFIKANEQRSKDTVFAFKMDCTAETVEQCGITIESPMPVVSMILDSIHFTATNPRNQTSDAPFTFTQDTTDIRKYTIRPETQFQIGYTYEIKIPQGTFTDVFGKPSKAAEGKINLPQGEELSTLTIYLKNVDTRYIVELTDESHNKTFRTYYVDSDSELRFPYLKAGKYAVRFTQDRNRNNIFDMGNLLEKRQPERVLMYKTRGGVSVFNIPERSEIEQDIDIRTMFR